MIEAASADPADIFRTHRHNAEVCGISQARHIDLIRAIDARQQAQERE